MIYKVVNFKDKDDTKAVKDKREWNTVDIDIDWISIMKYKGGKRSGKG